MVNGAFNPEPAAGDLPLQRGDPRFQLRDGQRIEILTHQLRQDVVGPGKGVVQIHDGNSVDRRGRHVNKAVASGRSLRAKGLMCR